MKFARSLVQAAFCLSTMSSLGAAMPTWVEELHLIVRQDDAKTTETPQETQKPSNDEETSSAKGGKNTANLNTGATLDPDATPTKGSKGGNSTKGTSTETFDVMDPVGRASFITPNIYMGPPLYKAGDEITWVWNYTNLQAEPTAIDLILSCTRQSMAWTLTGNMSFQDPATYTWDSKVQATDPSQPLLTEEYILIVKDSDTEIGDTGKPGYLGRTDQQMNIYLPRDPVSQADWNCPTCNSAPPELDPRALKFMGTMCLLTVLSFTWFVTGLNL
ncbi:related to WSC4 Cell wall integrity and stress response component 4 [Cephalotrichum gorgonifer]|uniref:Related to WSC4 Cell wall integrity and stress response component 4 n=1 Tax=Cephalotrichum gorgonifer TaxID=2041049 RepID=A0AAE8STY9_9PEZI|nr:related to WSC4 Cell wall integrity and stress response component 4 [Cephalotrichum gorgonifer]